MRALTWLDIHWAEARDQASVADLVMCERLASRQSSSETSSMHGAGCLAALGELVRLLVAWYPVVCGDPVDGHLVVAGENSVADLHHRDGDALAWAQSVGSHSVYSGSKGRVPVAALLALVDDAKCLVDGERLSVEDLFVRAEMEAAAGLATR